MNGARAGGLVAAASVLAAGFGAGVPVILITALLTLLVVRELGTRGMDAGTRLRLDFLSACVGVAVAAAIIERVVRIVGS